MKLIEPIEGGSPELNGFQTPFYRYTFPVKKCGKGRTKSEFQKDCDIGHILSKYAKTGFYTANPVNPAFDDFFNASSFHEAQNLLIEAEGKFMELPSKIRERFDNDPSLFLDFLDKKDNRQEAIDMGLIPPDPPPQQPIKVAVVAEGDGGLSNSESSNSPKQESSPASASE